MAARSTANLGRSDWPARVYSKVGLACAATSSCSRLEPGVSPWRTRKAMRGRYELDRPVISIQTPKELESARAGNRDTPTDIRARDRNRPPPVDRLRRIRYSPPLRRPLVLRPLAGSGSANH